MTSGSHWILERILCKDVMMVVFQKPEDLNRTDDSLQLAFTRRGHWTKGYTV